VPPQPPPPPEERTTTTTNERSGGGEKNEEKKVGEKSEKLWFRVYEFQHANFSPTEFPFPSSFLREERGSAAPLRSATPR
jgi:hypothetical protein